jgi:hypothetical protein
MKARTQFRSFGLAAMLAVFVLSPAVGQPLPLPRLDVNSVYIFGLPGGTEMRCTVLEPPAGEWVRCQSKTTNKELWINLGAIVYVIPPAS